MKTFSTQNHDSNYLAKFVELPRPEIHQNADKLQLVNIDYNTVIVGKDAKKGDLYCYFPLESCINKTFLSKTNSFSNSDLNADKAKKGFFNEKGRVRATRLRGIVSNGYLVPVYDLISTGFISSVEDVYNFGLNNEFDTINGELFCEKYVPASQRKSNPTESRKGKKAAVRHSRMVDGQFRFHSNTQNLKKFVNCIKPDNIITVSEKLHGTSAVFSNVLTRRKLTLKEKVAKFFGVKVQELEYGLVYSSRSVIKNSHIGDPGGFYKEDVWGQAAKIIEPTLQPGISIYAEIVGYTKSGKAIQSKYDYGCLPGEFKIYVYRITYTNYTGEVLEFTTPQMLSYCNKYGLTPVPIHFHGKASNYPLYQRTVDTFGEAFLNNLANRHLEVLCKMCKNKVPAEGVVVAVEDAVFTAYKLKSIAFLEGETLQLDSGDIGIDSEELQ